MIEVHVIEIGGEGLPKEVMESLGAFNDVRRVQQAAEQAMFMWRMAKEFVRRFDGPGLVEECVNLIREGGLPVTPEVLADRMQRIAALPKPVECKPDGSVYMAAMTNPLGNGEVWCEFPMGEKAKEGFAAAHLRVHDAANKRPT